MKQVYVGAVIADIHAGAFGSALLEYELNEGFLKYLRKMKILDFVVIAGDLFDSKISLNSEHTKRIFGFLRDLIEICKEKEAKLRIIKGTESHDNQQLDAVNNFFDETCDVKIINKVEKEYLFDNLKVLYLPEEYMKDPNEYYKEFYNDNYDMIFGHGMVREVSFVAKSQQSEVTMSKAPVFNTKNLLSMTKGPIFFGHIHKAQTIKNDFYYVGSYSRWVFGETEPKGFMTVAYTPDNGAYEVEFIENKNARTFDTMVVDAESFNNKDVHDQMQYLLHIVKNSPSDHLRVIFNIPEEYEQPTLLTNMINEAFNKNLTSIKVIINNNAKELKKRRETEAKVKTILSMYDFLFDKTKGTTPEEKLSKFIKIKFNKTLSEEVIRDILYTKLSVNIEE